MAVTSPNAKNVFKENPVSCFYGFHSFNDGGVFDEEEEYERFKHEMEKKKVAFRCGRFGNPVEARQFAAYGMVTRMKDRVIWGPKAKASSFANPNVLLVHLLVMVHRSEKDAAADMYVQFGKDKDHPHNFEERFDDVRNAAVGELKAMAVLLDHIYRANELDKNEPIAVITTSPFLAKMFAKGPLAYWRKHLQSEGSRIGTPLVKQAGKYVTMIQERFWERCNLCIIYERPDFKPLSKENAVDKGVKLDKLKVVEHSKDDKQ